ncbi:MAG: cyclic nucleotide-binding domain-containing protein, partial [Chitinophagaceae bacterium]
MSKLSPDKLLLFEKVLILKSLAIFSESPETILSELAPLMQEEEFEKGAILFSEGDIGDCMFVIYKGEVKIHKGSTTLAVLKEKEVFGELSLLDSETRSASATANTDCFLFKID